MNNDPAIRYGARPTKRVRNDPNEIEKCSRFLNESSESGHNWWSGALAL